LARTYRQLDLDQRRTLFRLVEARTPVGEIAARLGRHPSTIHRELGRNRFRDGDRGFCGYFPLNAQDLARRRRQRRRKLAADEGLRAHVAERLKAGWSPQQIAGPAQAGSGQPGIRLPRDHLPARLRARGP
jgi:IS30 family transposase